ncbi:helix-turn-helix transcriptional regulator [Marinomonas algarum]|uniref:Helix-turn-helix transcriptional regulator n=1 Tax=Marinomonas algarum TaxID=2883105 RepID=A0A9X1LFL6_9GAMM|nr:helix-turn-helix transcriptional regulator [Marinomonas algarum]MCB5163015.1 helix-turn-helix transcriptional regulator [Marinomonas algarum]
MSLSYKNEMALPDAQLVHALYEGLTDREGFHHFLELLRVANNACAAELVVVRKQPLQIDHLWYAGLPDDFIDWYTKNNMIQQDLVSRYATFQPPGVFHSALSIKDKLNITEDYQRWQNDQNMLDSAWLVIHCTDTHTILLTMQRTIKQGMYHPEDLARLNQLVPFIRQAILLCQQIDQRNVAKRTLTSVVNAMHQATLILNEQAVVIHSNPLAKALLVEQKLLSVRNERLMFQQNDVQNAYLRSSVQVIRASMGQGEYNTDTLFLHRVGRPPLIVLIRPMESTDVSRGGALVTIVEPTKRKLPKAETIGQYFTLSPAESELCEDLVAGLTLKEISNKSGKTEATIRSYLKNVFIKTNHSRQGELISSILSALLH